MFPSRCWLTLVVLGTLLVSNGCSNPPPRSLDCVVITEPKGIDLTLVTVPELNPSVSGKPSPIKITLYHLKNAKAFANADYFSLRDQSKTVLATDLLEQEELKLEPNQASHHARPLHPETQVLGMVAAYQDLDHALHWHQVIDNLPENKITSRVIRFDAHDFSVLPVTRQEIERECTPLDPTKPALDQIKQLQQLKEQASEKTKEAQEIFKKSQELFKK